MVECRLCYCHGHHLKPHDFHCLQQVAFRAFRCRRSYRALLVRRGRAATILQSAERRKRAFVAAADLREQRISRWEQLWDDESGRLYFYFKVNPRGLYLFGAGMLQKRLAYFPRDGRYCDAAEILRTGNPNAPPPRRCGAVRTASAANPKGEVLAPLSS